MRASFFWSLPQHPLMDPAKTLLQDDCSQLALASTGLRFLHEELLSTERGEEPNLDRVLRALELIEVEAQEEGVGDAPKLCARLRRFIGELREDGLELALEDVDVFLSTLNELRSMWSKSVPTGLEDKVELPRTVPPLEDAPIPEFLPEFLPSGLVAELRKGELHLDFAAVHASAATPALQAELEGLWQRSPASQAWSVDLTALERIPVALVATLAGLRIRSGAGARLIRLACSPESLRSTTLKESLSRYFQLL